MQHKKAGRATFQWTAIAAAAVAMSGTLGSPAFAAPGALATSAKAFVAPAVQDLGPASPATVKTFTIGLALRNAGALDPLLRSLSNPASPDFRHFLTPAQFAARFGQTDAAIASAVAYLQAQGIADVQVAANKLLIKVSATNAQIAAAFATSIHAYSQYGVSYEAPSKAVVVPAALSGVVASVSGLSTKPLVSSHHRSIPQVGALAGDYVAPPVKPAAGTVATGIPGSYTVGDVAALYNVNPLYAKGLTGAGKTIGIVTLAGYLQSDAYLYWSEVNLNVAPDRITDVPVDGGALPADGPGSRGAAETTLDVEQSGGLAPGANMRVYIGPNDTGNGFLDTFTTAVAENLVDVLSTSWGSPEIENDPSDLYPFHVVFAQAAAQGIAVIAAAGDAGAFDINEDLPYPACSALLTVDYPASDPYVLAAGGTTLPNTYMHKYGPVTVPAERAWGWDYLKDYITTYYAQSLYYSEYFASGGGGGVSVYYGVPSYQSTLPGVQVMAPAQALICGPSVTKTAGNAILAVQPAGYAGRNVPDVALNADPYSGYLVLQGGIFSGTSGGTSFVSPQINGILTLISQGIAPTAANPQGRLGSPGPQFYSAFQALGFGPGSPFRAITAGDNEYYPATATYNPATGLGSLDVNALAGVLGAGAATP